MTLLKRILISLAFVVGINCECCSGPHERYTERGPACIGDGCHPLINIRECDQQYIAGCFCECGYFRDFNGECVPAEKCPGGQVINVGYPQACPGHKCKGQYEYYTLSNSCIEQCPSKLIACLPPPTDNLGCFCLPGYKRNLNGNCVPENECCGSNTCPGENEYFTESNLCVDQCPPIDGSVCNALWNNPGCFCRPGFKRDTMGRCIPESQCPQKQQCTEPFEEFTSSNPCVDNCPAVDGTVCNALLNNPGCWCIQGYKRGPNGRCIPENECPQRQKCPGRYEYFTESNFCEEQCPPLDGSVCNALWNNPGCFCRPGFKRGPSGVCIPEKHCPKKPVRCGRNEMIGCKPCQSCAYERSVRNGTFLACAYYCPPDPTTCICIDGYVRDDNDICVPVENCFIPDRLIG